LPVVAFATVPVKVFTRPPLAFKRRTCVVLLVILSEIQFRFTLAVVAPGVSPSISGVNLVPFDKEPLLPATFALLLDPLLLDTPPLELDADTFAELLRLLELLPRLLELLLAATLLLDSLELDTPSLELELDSALTELLELIEPLELLLAMALLEEASLLLLEGSAAISEDEEISTFGS